MNELALFAKDDIMKPIIEGSSWKQKNAASAVTSFHYPSSIKELAQNPIIQLAKNVSAQWQKIGTSAIKPKHQLRLKNGGRKILMPLNSTDLIIDKNITDKNLFANMAFNQHGLTKHYKSKTIHVNVVKDNLNGVINKLRLMLIIAMFRRSLEGFFATDVIRFLATAKITINCWLVWQGI